MNWGWKIVLLYAAFVILTLSIAIYFMQKDVDLVSEDYYQQELVYQDKINEANNARENPVTINYDAKVKEVSIIFPVHDSTATISGKIYFYRPSDARLDQNFEINTDRTARQVVKVNTLMPGLWKLKITWQTGSTQYFSEKTLIL